MAKEIKNTLTETEIYEVSDFFKLFGRYHEEVIGALLWRWGDIYVLWYYWRHLLGHGEEIIQKKLKEMETIERRSKI